MKMLAKILARTLCVLMFLGAVFYVAPEVKRVYAETAEALQAQIDEILAKIAQVRIQFNLPLEQPGSIGIPSTFRFSRTLVLGAKGEDVRYLQILLNRDSDTRVNAPGLIGGVGAETNYFGLASKFAVEKFQNKYAEDVLRPAGLLRSTGRVGPFTLGKLNKLLALSVKASAPPVSVSTPPTVIPPILPQLDASKVPQATTPVVSFDEINRKTREALVNIICTSRRGGAFNLISGSGVVIDPRGVILTNAHLGQYF